jgi:hypothetical protein
VSAVLPIPMALVVSAALLGACSERPAEQSAPPARAHAPRPATSGSAGSRPALAADPRKAGTVASGPIAASSEGTRGGGGAGAGIVGAPAAPSRPDRESCDRVVSHLEDLIARDAPKDLLDEAHAELAEHGGLVTALCRQTAAPPAFTRCVLAAGSLDAVMDCDPLGGDWPLSHLPGPRRGEDVGEDENEDEDEVEREPSGADVAEDA